MPLRRRLEAVAETVQEMELAANARFFEGQALLRQGYDGAGVYLLGYTAEMLLKTAYFYSISVRPTERVGPLLNIALTRAKSLAPGLDVKPEFYHSLLFWRRLLRESRRQQNRPLPVSLDARFILCTHRLYQNWWVDIRYRRDQATPSEAASVLEDVTWLRTHYQDLWR